jgi:hypothetical protein
MKKTMWLLTTFFLLAAVSLAAQNAPVQSGERPRLAVVPFSGGDGDDGENIAELFSGSKDLAQVFRIYPRTGITFGMDEERNVQKYVVSNEEYRNQLLASGINYVVAGDITRLGQQSLLVISIIDIEKLVQIAGDVQIFEEKQEIEEKLPEMARNIINGTRVDWTDKPTLAVVNPRLQNNADPADANVLGEILGIEVTRTGKYAVYPRNATLEAVQAEWDNQRRGAAADPQGPGSADRPNHVLSVIARGGEGSVTAARFNASIINLDTGEQGAFATQTYRNIEDGIPVMRTIARELTITDVERAAATQTREKEAARMALLSAKERLDGIDGETRRQFAADYRKAGEAYFEGERVFSEGKYGAVQENINTMDDALNALVQKRQKASDSARAREEAAQVRKRAREEAREEFLSDRRRFLSFGAQTGTWFTTPCLIFSPKFTFSVFPYTFFDIACDAGILQQKQKVDYYSKYFSLYPSAHFNFFTPFSGYEPGGGWYIGAGTGWLYAYYGNDTITSTVSLWAFDTTSGFYFGEEHHYFNIAYTLRTNFERVNNKVSVGYTFRFY